MADMDYDSLYALAECAIEKIEKLEAEEGLTDALDSIKKQMEFIRENAMCKIDPVKELKSGVYFTYGIFASKELASLRELELKSCIDDISKILIEIDSGN